MPSVHSVWGFLWLLTQAFINLSDSLNPHNVVGARCSIYMQWNSTFLLLLFCDWMWTRTLCTFIGPWNISKCKHGTGSWGNQAGTKIPLIADLWHFVWYLCSWFSEPIHQYPVHYVSVNLHCKLSLSYYVFHIGWLYVILLRETCKGGKMTKTYSLYLFHVRFNCPFYFLYLIFS